MDAIDNTRPLSAALVDHLVATAIAPETVEGQVYITRAAATQVTPTGNAEAINAAQDALCDCFGPDAPINREIIADEFTALVIVLRGESVDNDPVNATVVSGSLEAAQVGSAVG